MSNIEGQENNDAAKKVSKSRKAIFSIAISKDVLEKFNDLVKATATNKSALIEIFIKDWIKAKEEK